MIQGHYEETKIITVVLATHHLRTTSLSPVFFVNLAGVHPTWMPFTKAEAKMVYAKRFFKPDWKDFFERLFYLCSGHPAAFTMGMNMISSHATGKKNDELNKLASSFLSENYPNNKDSTTAILSPSSSTSKDDIINSIKEYSWPSLVVVERIEIFVFDVVPGHVSAIDHVIE